MRPRYLPVPMISVTIFAAFLMLLAACSPPPGSGTHINAPPDVREELVERGEAQVDAGALIPAATEAVASQVPPFQDGPALLERHCTKCHLVQFLQKVQKSRTEWEKTLAQMEGMGVHLKEREKVNLLDYLTLADKP